jgi:hypothetical protein
VASGGVPFVEAHRPLRVHPSLGQTVHSFVSSPVLQPCHEPDAFPHGAPWAGSMVGSRLLVSGSSCGSHGSRTSQSGQDKHSGRFGVSGGLRWGV